MDYKTKYLEYKKKYLELKQSENIMTGGRKLKKRFESNKNGMTKYIEHVSEPWFTLISLGLKSVEGRKNKGKFKEMKVGDIIEWNNNDFGKRKTMVKITGKAVYKTFADYLETEGLDKCLPNIHSLEQGLNVYYKYYTKEQEAEFGVVAIRMELI